MKRCRKFFAHCALLGTLGLGLMLGGCTTGRTLEVGGKRLPFPEKGGPVANEIWTAAEAGLKTKRQVHEDSDSALAKLSQAVRHQSDKNLMMTDFAGPFVGYLRTLDCDTSATRLTATRFYDQELLAPGLLTLPLYASVRQDFYAKGSPGPVSHRRLSYNLFWASSREEGQVRDHASLSGVPLLWTVTNLEQTGQKDQVKARLTNTLWTLGPAWVDLEKVRGQEPAKIKIFTPLFLGGTHSLLLWSDILFEVENRHAHKKGESNERIRLKGGLHGPLFGALGYIGVKTYPQNPTSGAAPSGSARLVGLGAVWLGVHHFDGNDLHGPLWGMVGWSHKNERTYLRLFWYPIPLPKL